MTQAAARYPLRGEIWWTRFPTDPPDKGRRPVIVVSPDSRNCHPRSNTVLVIPLSTSIQNPLALHLLLRTGETGLREDSVAKAEDICTVRRANLSEPVAGHRPVTQSQTCRLAALVKLAMGCVE
ncbi:MAG: type II toxin-antitoxin system PemK/MazF family toxin [Terracidiphilus sp.]|jgi:mRNA-degrading endonuclease toxin of MazEF toxin-antitoxin module